MAARPWRFESSPGHQGSADRTAMPERRLTEGALLRRLIRREAFPHEPSFAKRSSSCRPYRRRSPSVRHGTDPAGLRPPACGRLQDPSDPLGRVGRRPPPYPHPGGAGRPRSASIATQVEAMPSPSRAPSSAQNIGRSKGRCARRAVPVHKWPAAVVLASDGRFSGIAPPEALARQTYRAKSADRVLVPSFHKDAKARSASTAMPRMRFRAVRKRSRTRAAQVSPVRRACIPGRAADPGACGTTS